MMARYVIRVTLHDLEDDLLGPFGRPMPEAEQPANLQPFAASSGTDRVSLIDAINERLYGDAETPGCQFPNCGCLECVVETPAETAIENERSVEAVFQQLELDAAAFLGRQPVYDDDLDAWRSPDDAPIGGTMGDAGDECPCPVCQATHRVDLIANETPFQRVLRQADEPDARVILDAMKTAPWPPRYVGGEPSRDARVPFSTLRPPEDAWSGARKLQDPDERWLLGDGRDRHRDHFRARQLERMQAQEAQARDAFQAEKQERAFRDSAARFAAIERDARRRNDGILVLWTDTPGKPGAVPLYSISHWGAH